MNSRGVYTPEQINSAVEKYWKSYSNGDTTIDKERCKKVVKKSANEETLEKILKLLEQQQKVKAEKAAEQIIQPPAYQPPVLETAPATTNQTFSYTLYDQATAYPAVTKPEIYINPQPQPLLIPQQPAPVVVEQPKKTTKAATVDQIIGLLKKAQAAQIVDDIEAQVSANGTISSVNMMN